MEIVNKIPDRSAVTMNYDFVKQQGIVVLPETMKAVTKSVSKGAEILNGELKQEQKSQGFDR